MGGLGCGKEHCTCVLGVPDLQADPEFKRQTQRSLPGSTRTQSTAAGCFSGTVAGHSLPAMLAAGWRHTGSLAGSLARRAAGTKSLVSGPHARRSWNTGKPKSAHVVYLVSPLSGFLQVRTAQHSGLQFLCLPAGGARLIVPEPICSCVGPGQVSFRSLFVGILGHTKNSSRTILSSAFRSDPGGAQGDQVVPGTSVAACLESKSLPPCRGVLLPKR